MSKIAGDGVALFWTSVLLLALCWITFAMRAGVRLWRKIWGIDDIVMAIGLVRFCCVPFFGLRQRVCLGRGLNANVVLGE